MSTSDVQGPLRLRNTFTNILKESPVCNSNSVDLKSKEKVVIFWTSRHFFSHAPDPEV